MSKDYDHAVNENSLTFISGGFNTYIDVLKDDIKDINEFTYKNITVVGIVTVLHTLGKRFPNLMGHALIRYNIKEWRQIFLDWAESKNSKIPKNIKDQYISDSVKEFDGLIGIIE